MSIRPSFRARSISASTFSNSHGLSRAMSEPFQTFLLAPSFVATSLGCCLVTDAAGSDASFGLVGFFVEIPVSAL